MPEARPLRGQSVAVIGTAAAADHARLLLCELGATVQHETSDVVGIINDSADSISSAVPVVSSRPRAVVEDWARSGAMALTPSSDGIPQAAGAGAASSVRAALLVFELLTLVRTGKPIARPGVALLGERAALAGLDRDGSWSVGGAGRALRALDGWWFLSLPRESDHDLVGPLVEQSRYDDSWDAVEQWSATRSAAAASSRAQSLGLAAAPIPQSRQPADDQPASRGDRMVSTQIGGRVARSRLPLVVDLTALWAGPLCASLVGLTGADIVKVESIQRPDGARSGPIEFYNLMHAGHRSVALDFTTTSGRDQLRGLIRTADIVLESSRPRALQQLGVCAETEVKRGAVWVSITGYGRWGPGANRIGFGDDVAAGAGLVAWQGNTPISCGDALADPLAGVHAAAAVAAAMLDDRGYLVDVSMRDVARAAAQISSEPYEVVRSTEGTWEARWSGGNCEVSRPTARPSRGSAAALGAHTSDFVGQQS